MQAVLNYVGLVRDIVTILAIIAGAFWSWYQFSIGDLLKPNFTLKVTLVSVSGFTSARLVVVRVTVRNVGRVTIEHANSRFRVFSIHGSETAEPEVGTTKAVDEAATSDSPDFEKEKPFSPVYDISETWDSSLFPTGVYPFLLRPGEEVAVDVPLVIKDPSIIALKTHSSFHCTNTERIRIQRSDGTSSMKKVPYGSHIQHVLDLAQASSETRARAGQNTL